jgi:hypothetical protein
MTEKIALMVIAVLLAQVPAFAADPAPATANPPVQQPAATPAPSRAKGAVDRLQLDPTVVTGNRELPKVMNIVPWKAPEPPGGPDRPLNSLVEEVLSPLDRDEFRREITYYRDLTGPSTPFVAPGATKP